MLNQAIHISTLRKILDSPEPGEIRVSPKTRLQFY